MGSILYVVNAIWFFLSHRLPLAIAARDAGFVVHVAGDFESENELQQLQRYALHFHHVPVVRATGSIAANLRLVRDLCAIYRDVKPSVVHHVTAKPIIIGSLAARLVGHRRVVNAVSGLGYAFASNSISARLIRLPLTIAYRLALSGAQSYSIFQNRTDQDTLLYSGATRSRSVLIPGSGVDLEKFVMRDEAPGTRMVLLPARMLRDKGVIEFCLAAERVRRVLRGTRFVLAGRIDLGNPSGLSANELRMLCSSTGVEWVGDQQDIASLMSSAHVVCLPSYREGIPKALVEACAAGRAIVTTDVPGCRDVVTDGQNGLLVPRGSVDELAAAIARLLGDDRLRRTFGNNARRRAEAEFDVRRVTERTIELYQMMLSTDGARR